jgi:hypothetical protein
MVWSETTPIEEVQQQQKLFFLFLGGLVEQFSHQLAAVSETPFSLLFFDQMRQALERLTDEQQALMQKYRAGDDPQVIVDEYNAARNRSGPKTPKPDLSAWERALDESQPDEPSEPSQAKG